jgi:hypothetical protein
VCTYWKPLLVKNSWVAKASALRTRITAPMVLVLRAAAAAEGAPV